MELEVADLPAEDGQSRVECRFENETIWLSQALMAELFETTPQNITLHLKALYEDEEINAEATCKEYLQVRQEGSRTVKRSVKHYNLEAILAVGFRVRSRRGAQFRRWANDRIQEYLVKGFVMDDERLKNPPIPGTSAVPDYFDELLARIRDIRTSERRMYLRVRELFTLAADYEPTARETTQFFRIIQNKLHFAATGKTAAELIAERANASQPNMGLTVWKGEIVRKGDVTVAKNYLHVPQFSYLPFQHVSSSSRFEQEKNSGRQRGDDGDGTGGTQASVLEGSRFSVGMPGLWRRAA
jgi:hypothetical protein